MSHEPGHEEEPQDITPAPLVTPEGFAVEDTDAAKLDRLALVRTDDEADEGRKKRSFARRAYEAVVEPIARAATKAADETSDAVVGLGGFIVNQAVSRGVGTEAYRDDFLNWYQQKDRFNPFTAGDEFRDDHLGGPSDTMFEGLLEGGAQFAFGFVGAGKLLAVTKIGKLARGAKAGDRTLRTLLGGQKPGAFGAILEGIGAGTGKKAAVTAALKLSLKELAFETSRGAIADFAVFDGHEQRLADLMETHSFLKNPIQQFLLSDEDDSDFEGRMKNLLEGAMLGASIDIFLGGIRGLRAWRRATAAAKAGDEILLTNSIDEMVEIIERDDRIRQATIQDLREVPEGERAIVVDNEDGTASLLVKLSDDETLERAAFADSGELGRIGMENKESAVIDPDSGFMGRGTTHEEARRAVAAKRLGMDIDSDEVTELADELAKKIPLDMEGFIERGAPNSAFETRAAAKERLTEQTLTGQSEMRFDNRAEAEEVGAALEMVERARFQQRQIDSTTGFDPETAEAFQRHAIAVEAAYKSGDKDAIFKITSESSVNLKYIYNGQRAKAALGALAQQYPEVGKRVQFSFDEIKRIGGDMIPKDASEAQVRLAMGDVFLDTENLAGNVTWMRAWTISLGNEAQKLAQLVEGAQTRAARDIHMAELVRSLDNLLDTSDLLTGTLSNIGRGLRSGAIPLGPRKIRGAGKSAVVEIKGAVESIGAQLDDAVKAGGDTTFLDKQLQEALDALEKIMKETTDEKLGIEPAAKPAAAGASEAPVVLSTAERRAALTKRADELLEIEGTREAKLRDVEGFEAPTAPLTRRSIADMSVEDIDALTRAVFNADNGEPAEILRALLVPATKTVAEDGARFLARPALQGFAKARAAVQWFRVNAMLSGPRTHAINTISNTSTAILRPVEMAVGGALHGNKESVRQAADLLVGYGLNLGDHWRAARKAMKNSQGVLDPKSSHFSGSFANTQAALRGGTASLMTSVVGTPGKLLMGLDEFASQINYRSHLRAGALKEGRRLGRSGDDLAGFVEAQLRMGYGVDGQGINKAAIEFARENTFKAELGTAGQKFEDFVNSETVAGEVLQFLMPFRRTPINITKFAWERMPGINALGKKHQQAMSGALGQAAKEEALGKTVVGTTMYATAAWLFFSGKLTGSGPSDPRARSLWLDSGKKPGTLTVGNLSIELRRMDPVLTPFVIAANLFEAAGELDDETNREAATLLMLTMAESVAERSFFTGLTEFLEAATGGNEDMMTRWTENAAASLIPNILKQGNYDGIYREADGFVEEILKNTIGFSQNLEMRRNLFGEPSMKPAGYGQRAFNPFTMTWGATVGQELAAELYDLGSTMTLPSEKKSFGEGGTIDLRQRGKYASDNGKQSPYDRWMELAAGKKANGGRTLKARIVRLTETGKWAEGDPVVRRNLLERIITQSRAVAWQQMLSEYPTLRDEVIFRQQIGTVKNLIADEETLQSIRDQHGLTEKGRFERLRERISK